MFARGQGRENMKKEIRFHGRGGQGVVMASELLAAAIIHGGRHAAAFPFFYFERRQAPLTAFLRFDETPVREKTNIYTPDCVVVLDATVHKDADVFAGLSGDGVAVLTSSLSPESIEVPDSVRRLAVVDGASIAQEAFHSDMGAIPLTSTAMLGAFAQATDWISLDWLKHSLAQQFTGDILSSNLRACEMAYRKVVVKTITRTGGNQN